MRANATLQRPSKSGKGLALLCAVLLSGCATREAAQLPDMSDWATRTTVLAGVEEWEFSGRVAVSAGDEGFNGNIRWAQNGDSFRVTIGGPLGIGTVRIDGDGETVVHTDKNGVRTELQNAEQELQYRYGWTIPVTSLRYWALGLPDPTQGAQTELNADDLLARLVQSDWTVHISRYSFNGGHNMPKLLSATSADTRVRIVFDKWMFFD